MAVDLLAPLGPLFGPNTITIQQNDETGRLFQLQVYPDANNEMLRNAGVSMHFYFVPQRVFLARKQTAPDDFDFAMTVVKGLMTPDTTLGITDDVTQAGGVEVGGGFCTFSTTFAVPESVIRGAVVQLRGMNQIPDGQPDPQLGIVTIVENNVSIEVPELASLTNNRLSPLISAQGAGKGSVEATGISSFLVSMNQIAAGAVAGSLKAGKSPFTVHYNLKQQFYINACQVEVNVDVDKVFDQFSAALSAGGFFWLDDISLSYAYQSTVTNGGITTKITMNGAVVDEATKARIDSQVDELRKFAMDLVKKEIFDFQPTPDAPATASRGFFSSLFGGFSVSMKKNYQRRQVTFTQPLEINGTIAVYDTKSGALNDLEPAIRADLDKYLVYVDVGEPFQKVQVVGQTNVNWGETLPDGTKYSDPIESVLMEVGYPNFNTPTGADGTPNPQFRGEGFHYVIGEKDNDRPTELAAWTNAENGEELVNISFLKLQEPIEGWDQDEVIVRKTLVYDPSDPRVDFTNGRTTIVVEERTKSHSIVITPDEVGFVLIKFVLTKRIVNDALLLIVKVKIGDRVDTFMINKDSPKIIIWQLYSDKYFDVTSLTYEVEVTATGPNFTDEDIVYSSPEPVTVDLEPGRLKYVAGAKLVVPAPPADQVDKVNEYVRAFSAPV